jgi:dipeptidyl aminopeptidase/acylaminoacyl peptidase
MNRLTILTPLLLTALLSASPADAASPKKNPKRFQPADVFQLEFASDPQVHPDGRSVVYVRNAMDVMTDRARKQLWLIDVATGVQRPLTDGEADASSPRWSPFGDRLLYLSELDDRKQLFVRWMDTGQASPITNLTESPEDLAWSPDGRQVAFSMLVPDKKQPLIEMPEKPQGAKWSEPFKEIHKLRYRYDGKGYLKDGYHHLFVAPADGGSPRQLTRGAFHHRGRLAWSDDGASLICSANRHKNWEYKPVESELYEVPLDGGKMRRLTRRKGADHSPVISPDGRTIAYLGFDDQRLGHHLTRLYLINRDGGDRRVLTGDFDRSIDDVQWADDGAGLCVQYDDRGTTHVGYVSKDGGEVRPFAENVGGVTFGRPYASGSFSVAAGVTAFTKTRPERPADVAVIIDGEIETRLLTHLNDDLLDHKTLGTTEEIEITSSHDQRKIQAWVVKPPGFDPTRKYPLILEIHGGPHANYGPRFSAEIQLYAAAGYVVVYANPRGSTGYGQEFASLIQHAYPGHDYDDLMSAVDALAAESYIDADQLYVTGGSGGGILSAWIIGRTDRFRAAVVCKPVINWYSFVLTSDAYNFFADYWFPGPPWDHAEHYLRRSPISQAGNITTPTMLMTGEADYRTPISESEQLYQALKLRKIDTMLVRVPGSSHGIASRPSRLIAKVAYVLKWFDMHGGEE